MLRLKTPTLMPKPDWDVKRWKPQGSEESKEEEERGVL